MLDYLLFLFVKAFNYSLENFTFSGVLSICAIVLTIRELRTTQRHNRISVKPFLTDTTHTDNGDTQTYEIFELINNGLGPAFIKKFEVLNGDSPLEWKDHEDLQGQLQKSMPFGKILHMQTYSAFSAITANERNTILKVIISNDDLKKFKGIESILPQYTLRIEYESMYGEKMVYNSRQGLEK